jgi:chemotaxis protein methyltransferase CheR
MAVSPEDFDFISKLVREEIGIVLDVGKEYLVETRLGPIANSEGFGSLDEFVSSLRSVSNPGLRQAVLDAMTTNETLFFRDAKPFEAIRSSIIPNLKEVRSSTRTISIWSAACSTGQEPYSLAILLRENFPELAGWNVRIYATDISSQVLSKAREGVYTQFEVNRGLPANLLMKYFSRKGMKWKLNDDVRDMVRFSQLNLLGDWRDLPKLDIVLMRNVLIYFDDATKQSLLSKVRERLQPDGYFLVGGSETVTSVSSGFIREVYEQAQVYRLKS